MADNQNIQVVIDQRVGKPEAMFVGHCFWGMQVFNFGASHV